MISKTAKKGLRLEKDALGVLHLPDNVYYGIQSERARNNFSISGINIGHYPKFVWAIAAIKKSAALANMEIHSLEKQIGDAICLAADEVMRGDLHDQFPIDIFQGGGGTSSNMNVNEVIAHRANEILNGDRF